MPATTTGPEGAGCAQDSRARSLVREQSVLDREAVGVAADGADGAQHSMARDEGRQQVARARSAGGPNRAGSPGPRGELRVADGCLLYTSPSPRDRTRSRMPSSA